MGEIAPEEQFHPLSTLFYYLMLNFYVKTGIRFSLRDKRLFEITEVEITRVDCICFLPSKPLANKLGETNLFFKLEKYVCKTQRMRRVDPTFHFIRLPKVSLGPALNSFKYLSKFQLHNKSLVFEGCNFVKMICCPSKMHTHILIMSVTSMQS